jgi:hypothetical protein
MLPARLLLFVVAAAAALLTAGSSYTGAEESSPPFLHLFNGQDLADWDGDPRFWSVQDGAITGETTPVNPTPRNTFLIWRGGLLRDFELHVTYRIAGGNSGIQYRSKDLGDWIVSGYQADFDAKDEWTGIFYEERGRGILGKLGELVVVQPEGKRRVLPLRVTPDEIRTAFRADDWNEYVITMRGYRVRHMINGERTVEATDDDAEHRAREGILAFQLHAGEPMRVQFKDIRLRILGE